MNLSFYVFDWDGTNVVDDDFLGTTNLSLSVVSSASIFEYFIHILDMIFGLVVFLICTNVILTSGIFISHFFGNENISLDNHPLPLFQEEHLSCDV